MSEEPGAATEGDPSAGAPSEEELRAAYEQQIKRVQVDQILLENVVTLLNLGMRRTGLSAGTEDERDPAQVRLAIESVRAVLPLLEQAAPEHVRQVRDALSQLQLAFVRIGGGSEEAGDEPGETGEPAGPPPSGQGQPPKPGEAGPAQRSGRLWVPGQ